MLFNIILFFIILIILTLILYYTTDYKEGFFDFPVANHNTFVNDSTMKFNQLTNTINLTDPALPVSPDSAAAFKIALGGLSPMPSSTVYDLQPINNFTIPTSSPNTFQQAQVCEAQGPSCNAFDNPIFAANCGISFDKKGIGANGKPHIGGLYVSPSDKSQQLAHADAVLSSGEAPYDPYKVYQPTLGKSKPGSFALTKDQCNIVKEKVECLTKQTFGSPNCTQCYTSHKFARVGPKTGRISSILNLFGNGTVTIASDSSNIDPITLEQSTLDPVNQLQVTIPGSAEGTVFTINVQPIVNTPLTYIAGFIQGQTPSGVFKLDLMNLIQSDLVTNSKPSLNGSITVGGFRCVTIVPGNTQTTMNLSCLMPFSFLNMYDGDALTCDNSPIITQAASATFLESDPCFGKKNQPGNYALSCLQERWTELGGTPQGTGYPSNQAAADLLQKDSNGNSIDIDTIVNNVSAQITQALTGQDSNGNPLNISTWNTLSMWATGIPINTPCDGPTSTNGPLSQDCLSYLYLNQGVNSHIGGTYTMTATTTASMKGQIGQNMANTYCQSGTSIDPSTVAGLKFGQSLGGINAVKQSYDQINRLANDNTQQNAARSTAVNQCYGVSLNSMASSNTSGPVQVFAVGPTYQYTQAQAQQTCSQYGAQVATSDQLQDAQTYGADWCFAGWVSDNNTPQFPITTSTQIGCGNGITGIKSGMPPGNVAGVNCYGAKPGIDNYPANTIMPFSQTLWDQPSSLPIVAPVAPLTQGIFIATGGTAQYGYNIWYSDTNLLQSNMVWTQITGQVTTVSLAPNGSIFATNSANGIFYLANYKNTPNFIQIKGALRQISTDGVNVVGTNSNNNAFTASISQAIAGQWIQLPSVLTKIVTFNNQYYCIGLDTYIYYLTSPSAQWIKTLTTGLFIDIAMDNNVILLIGTDHKLYYSDSQLFTPSGLFQQVLNQPTTFNKISLSNGSIYAVDINGQPWYTSNYKNTNWTKVSSSNQDMPSHRVTIP